jgi:hypothetical protein
MPQSVWSVNSISRAYNAMYAKQVKRLCGAVLSFGMARARPEQWMVYSATSYTNSGVRYF